MIKPEKLIQINHQDDTDLISSLLELDRQYVYQRHNAYRQFLITFKKTYFNQQPSNNFFMTLKQQYINFAHLITKNALVATVLMLFALTTVTAAAAELVAPTEYKPSTILNLKSEINQSNQSTVISSSSSSSSSLANTQEVVSNPNPTNNIYTNNLVPDLKLNYTGWSIEKNEGKTNNIYCQNTLPESVTPENSIYPCHKIYLRKNGAEINITIQTATEWWISEVQNVIKINESLFRGSDNDGNWFYSKENPTKGGCFEEKPNKSCLNQILDSKIYEQQYGLILSITYTGPESLLPEVDQMVLNSGIQF